MTLHSGPIYADGDVTLRPPDAQVVRGAVASSDVRRDLDEWLGSALTREDIYYFAVYEGETFAGQIFLHDIDSEKGSALIGYHLRAPSFRGRGIGTAALRLLQQFVAQQTSLHTLVAITTRDNVASQSVATRCSFTYSGPSIEDPTNGMVFRWPVPR